MTSPLSAMDCLSISWFFRHFLLVLAVLWNEVDAQRRGKRTDEERPQPRFLDTPQNFTYREGELARLECSLLNLGTKKVIWRRFSDPHPLTIGRSAYVDDTRITVEHLPFGEEWHLLIKRVRLDDAGQYECQVASQDKDLRRYVNLIVKPGDKRTRGTPEIFIDGTQHVEKNEDIRLQCNATGKDHSPDDIDWFLNGQKLDTDSSQVSILKRVSLMDKTIYSILEVKNAQMTDAGIYVCRTSDLQIISTRVDVLNAESPKLKRDGADVNDPNYFGSQDTTGNHSHRLSSNVMFIVCMGVCASATRRWLCAQMARHRLLWFFT